MLGSEDGRTWKPLATEGLVFDYSRYMDIGNQDVRLPKNDFRELKIRIAGIADEQESPFRELAKRSRRGSEVERMEWTSLERRPFRIDRIELWREDREKLSEREKKAAYDPVEWKVEENAADKTTIVNVSTRREPLTRLTLAASSRNFSRPVEVQAPVVRGVRTDWVPIGHGQIMRIDLPGYSKESLNVDFGQRREAQYRLVIRNDDNPPLSITGVEAQGNVYRAVFLPEAEQKYRLAYGSDEAEPPKYETAAILAALRPQETPNEGKLGAQTANAAAGGCPWTFRKLVNNPWLLGVVVVVLASALGWALFRAVRRIDAMPK